jgi:PAS domain S-box-containing protein
MGYDMLLMVVDRDGVVVQWSHQAEELAGCTADQVIGQPVAHLVTRVAAGARGAARAGQLEVLVPGADSHSIGELRLRPVPRPDGSVAWAVFQAGGEGATPAEAQAAAAQPWSEAEKHQTRLRVGNRLRARIGQALDVVAVCQDVADALVPDFADVAVVDVVDSVIRGENPPLAPLGREVPLRRAAFRYGGGEPPVHAYPVGEVHRLPFPGPYAQVLTDLRLRVIDLGPDLPWLSADPQRAAAIRASGVRTLIAVPLTLRGTVLGLLSLYSTQQGVCAGQPAQPSARGAGQVLITTSMTACSSAGAHPQCRCARQVRHPGGDSPGHRTRAGNKVAQKRPTCLPSHSSSPRASPSLKNMAMAKKHGHGQPVAIANENWPRSLRPYNACLIFLPCPRTGCNGLGTRRLL